MQAIYDLVGDKIQEIFDAQVVIIGMFDFAAGGHSVPRTRSSAASRFPDEPTPIELSPDPRAEMLETKAPAPDQGRPGCGAANGARTLPVSQGEPALPVLSVPLGSGDDIEAASHCRT